MTIERFFQLVTHFGDSAFLIPFSIAVITMLLWSGSRLVALRFAVAVACLMAGALVLKIGFYAIGGDPTLDVLSPSGHAGFSVTVYGCCAAILANQCRPAAAALVITAAAALMAAVMVSRVVIGAHTPTEVVIGSCLGLGCIVIFLLWNPDLNRLNLRVPAPLAVVLILASLSVWAEARQFNSERHIEHVGVMVGSTLGTLPATEWRPHKPAKVWRLTD